MTLPLAVISVNLKFYLILLSSSKIIFHTLEITMASKVPTIKQLTLALIKPDILPLNYTSTVKLDQILAILNKNQFEVLTSKELHLSKEQAELFYEEHRGKFFYQRLVSFMTRFNFCMVLLRSN